MANKPDPGRCVHCLQFYDELTWDHVFPKSWYPDTTPEDIEKWKIPACLSCNKEYGRIEEELLIKLGLCIDPQNPRGAGIAFKAVRALRSDYGKNDKDAKLRKQKKEKIFREAKYGMDIPKESIYPGYESKGENIDEQMGLPLEDGKIRKLTEKIVRGIMFISNNKYIESPYHIQYYAYNFDALRNVLKNVYPGPFEVFKRPPGLVVLRALAVEDKMSGIYLIDIWGQFFCVAIVHKHVNTV
jgi:hypothetical protein